MYKILQKIRRRLTRFGGRGRGHNHDAGNKLTLRRDARGTVLSIELAELLQSARRFTV